MPARIPDDLTRLRSAARHPDRFDAAVDVLRRGLENREVRNVALNDAKLLIGRAVEKAWDRDVREPYFHAGRFQEQPDEIRRLDNDISISSLHSVISTAKKVARSEAGGPVIAAMRGILAEALPLAESVVALKPYIVKGRAPNANAPARPANSDKVIGTCSCCFRGIAVTDSGRMAHHGYRRPGYGYQTSSCSGVQFPPLERSTEGLEWLISVTRGELEEKIERLDRKDEINVLRWTERRRGVDVDFEVRRGQEGWNRRLVQHVARLTSDIRREEGYLEMLGDELEKWRPEAEVDPGPNM